MGAKAGKNRDGGAMNTRSLARGAIVERSPLGHAAVRVGTAKDNGNHDDDPSPAGGRMPIPAILKNDGPANDHHVAEAITVESHIANDNSKRPNRVEHPLPIHPTLCHLLRVRPEEIEHRADALKLGAPARVVETYKGEIITLDSWIEACALESLGLSVDTTPVPDDLDPVEHVLRTIPPLRDFIARAIAVNLSREVYEADSKKAMSEGGKRGAAKRHSKPVEEISDPKSEKGAGSKSYPDWIVRGSRLTGDTPCDVIRQVARLYRDALDMFTCLQDGRITHLADAVNLHKRFPKSSKDRLGCLRAWRKARLTNPTLRIVDYMGTFVTEARTRLATDKFTKSRGKHRAKPGKTGDVCGPGYDLRFGTMETKCKDIEPESCDIAYADILYDAEHLEPMAEQVGFLAVGHLPPGGSLVLCAGNFNTRKAINAVMKGAKRAGFSFEEPIVIYVHYLDGKNGKGLPLPVRGKNERGIGKIDGLPHFLFRKAGTPGVGLHKIANLYFESLAQNNGEPIYHLYNKNPRCIADMVAAIRPDAKPLEGGPALRIIDYCMGWGSTGVAARRAGHEFVGVEMSNDGDRYRIACRRIAEARPGVWPKPKIAK